MSLTIEFDSPSVFWLQQNLPVLLIATWLVVSCLVGLYAARRVYATVPDGKDVAFLTMLTAPIWVPVAPAGLLFYAANLLATMLITVSNNPPENKE